jgi:hypothetical protein
MNGAAVWGYPEGTPETIDPCATGTFGVKSEASTFSTPDFAAFTVYLPITCSSFTVASDPAGFARRAEVALDAITSWALEQALSQGIPMSLNPFLADANVTVLASGAAVPPAVGLSYLEDAIGATARQGMLHATPGVASQWFDDWRDMVMGEAASLVTACGTPVAVGGGYAGATPDSETPAAAGEAWVYATGPVHAYIERELTLDIKDVLDRSDNDVTFRAERYALVEWDTALQAAVLIDWQP